MKIDVEKKPIKVKTLRDFVGGEAVWIPLFREDASIFPNCETALVMRTKYGYVSLETGYVNTASYVLSLPAIKANVKVVEDKED